MTIEKLAKDVRTYVFLFCLVVAVVVGVTGWHKLPARVEKNEVGIKDVSNTFDKYMMRQMVIEEQADKRADIMFKLLMKDK